MLEDEQIIKVYISGNRDAIEILMDRYKEPLYRFCYHLTSNKNEAEDLFQDTWLKVINKIVFFDVDRKFSTWLYSITLNLYRDKYRKAKRWLNRIRFMFTYEDGNDEVESLKSSDKSMEERLVAEEEKQTIRCAINSLKDVYRIPLILFYYKDMSYEDISNILEIPIGTVKSRLNYGKKLMKETLEVTTIGKR